MASKITLKVDTQQATRNVNNLKTKITELADVAKKIKIEIKTDGIKDINNANKTFADYSKSAEQAAASGNKFTQSQANVGKSASKTAGDTKKAASGLKETGEAADQASQKMQGFISTFVKSAIIYQAIYAVRQAFLDALDVMKQVDSQLVTVRKVTQASAAEIDQLRDKAYSTASKYGVGAADYLESVAQFARAGYKDQSDALAELSTKTQIVGDTTAEVANQFLLSMDAAYQYEGSISKLTAVLDGANEIDNNYATSIEKIAEGLGLIAPIAAQVHMTEAELTAAIGTITAVTQRSGSEAARALRALVLNIIGDTTTEIEDGVTATKESVASLQSLLREYAPDAVAAAEATGQIIDPMEAIKALSKAVSDGLLTEQQLMEKLSSLGGKLRTSQLVALVSNFDMYEDMLSTYSNAVGSADREVENALDSWERKAAILGNTWTDLIQKSFSTDFFKDFIDGLTQVLKLFGNLGTVLLAAGGAFVALKLPSIISSFKEWASSIAKAGSEMTILGVSAGTVQLAIAGVTAAITVGIMAYNAYRQAIEQAIESANKRADQEAEEARRAADLYEPYAKAKEAYENGTGSKEAYKEATIALAEALGMERSEIGKNANDLKRYTAEEIEAAKKASELAIKLRMNDWKQDTSENPYIKYGGYAEVAGGEQKYWDFESSVQGMKSYLDRAKAIVKTYDEAVKIQEELADATKDGSAMTEKQTQEWEYAGKVISKYGDYVDELRENLNTIDELEGIDLDSFDEAAEGAENLNENLSKTEQQFSSLAKAAGEASEAIQKYKDATKVEKDDNFKEYATMYEEFLTDWEAGLKGSNKVQAAIQALLPEDVINDLWKQGKDAGELLASEFYQGIFTYIDDNGQRQFTKGEDRGSLLAYALWDSDTLSQYVSDSQRVIKLGDEVVASLTMNGDELSVSVSDFDKLAQAMYEISGVPLSGDALAAWMQALGMYSPELQMTAEEINNVAEAAGALNEKGQINLEEFVKGELKLGTPKEEIRQMVDKIVELNGVADSGISIDVETGSVEEAKQKCAELIEKGEDPIEIVADTQKAMTDILAVSAKTAALNATRGTVTVTAVDQATGTIDRVKQDVASIPRNVAINISANIAEAAKSAISKVTGRSATGTMGAAGGMTLVNELGPEIIQEGASARIAGGGQPTITWVEPGATIYNAVDTKSLLQGLDPSVLFNGIAAFAGGTASGITRWRQSSSNAAASAAGTAVASSAAKGVSTSSIKTSSLKSTAATSSSPSSGSSSSDDKDAELQRLKDIVSLRQSELELLKAQDASVKDQVNKQKQIQDALMAEINRLKAIGGSQEEINKLYTDWYKVQKEIADLQDSLYNELKTAINGQITKLNDAREEEKKKIQEQLDAMEEQRNTRDEQLDLEEKILAVQKAEAALQTAMTDRTVRYYNALTGQWEWGANAQNVKSAAEQLEQAQKALEDYQSEKSYQEARAALEAEQDAIDAKYDDLEARWKKVTDSLEAPVESVAEALTLLAKNYIPTMATDVKNLNKLLEQFGYSVNTSAGKMTYRATDLPVFDSGGVLNGMGGIKATSLDEMVLPPDITAKMLSVNAGNMFATRMNELRYLYGVGGSMAGTSNTSIGTQHNGNVYRFGNISLTEQQARTTTVAELARLSRSLSLYSAQI